MSTTSYRPDPTIAASAVGSALIVLSAGWILELGWLGVALAAVAAAAAVILLDAFALKTLDENENVVPPPIDTTTVVPPSAPAAATDATDATVGDDHTLTTAAAPDPDAPSDHPEPEIEVPPDRKWIRIPKIGATLEECEDAAAASSTQSAFAVADGASSSFDAASWSRILVDQFCQSPLSEFSTVAFHKWITLCREVYGSGQQADRSDGWWAEEGSRQGAFTTFLGARIVKDHGTRCALVIAVGDSCALLYRPAQQRLVASVPLDQAGQFGSHPMLIGSSPGEHIAAAAWTLLPVETGDVLMLATDAVAEWALGHPDRVTFLAESDIEEAGANLAKERSAGSIVNDDLTLLIHHIDE